MIEQLDFFASPLPVTPEGFRYQPDIIAGDTERALLEDIRHLPFKEFEFHGYIGKRRTVSFGWRYDYDHEVIQPTADLPEFLLALRRSAAEFAGLLPAHLQQVLVTEYGPGAAIGWHRDKAVFGEVIGISVLSPCEFRLRRQRGARWDRVTLKAQPRSAYLLSGAARTEWEHSVPPVKELRYSITFRTIAKPRPLMPA